VSTSADVRQDGVDSTYSWIRLAIVMTVGSIGAVGFWSGVVVLPAVQADFAVDRGAASLPSTLTMLGLGLGGVLMGRLADRFGAVAPVVIGGLALGLGYLAAGLSQSLWQFALAHGLLIAIGGAAGFGPMVADISHWFRRRRGLAMTLCACGNYIGGAIWPPVVHHFLVTVGWRQTHMIVGGICVVTMVPLAFLLRRRPPRAEASAHNAGGGSRGVLGLSPLALQVLLAIAGLACCVAMSMPQVHIVAYCGDLGYGVGNGAEILSLMLAGGVLSRIGAGLLADRLGGLGMLLVSSLLQTMALSLYLGFTSLPSLYVISAMFGLVQGGLVPSYAIIAREYFPASEAGTRVGILMMATLFGMALGGWISGVIFDMTGSYAAAFANGVAWNMLNFAIAATLMWRSRRYLAPA
jgi:MFS family permease